MAEHRPAAFLSYVHFDDEHEAGRLTELRKRLSAEVQLQMGEPFPIFQDRANIQWGQDWKQRIEGSLDAVTFLIPVITPGFFKSRHCRSELERFLKREQALGRTDLVLPIYYVDYPPLNDEAQRATEPLAAAVASHQYADWRELRFESFTSPTIGKMLEKMALQIRDALERTGVRAPTETARGAPDPTLGSANVSEGISSRQSPDVPGTGEAGGKEAGPAPKTEPPNRVVDPLHRGDHVSITQAIEAAKPGDRILIRPGLYGEGLVIDKPLELIGDGAPGEVVVQATGMNVILFQTTMGRVANLTLRQQGGGNWFDVDIAQGRLELEDCDITSQSLACVAIHAGADPRLRRNRIHDGKEDGVLVYENGRGTLEDNEILANALVGVEIRTGGDPTLRRNRIHDSKHAGVLVWENGRGMLEDNEVFANAYSGVEIMTGGDPTLRNNRLSKNAEWAVYVHDGGGGTIVDNDLRGNEKGPWNISQDSKAMVTRARNQE
jgi:parallel beta-helix repeat protein